MTEAESDNLKTRFDIMPGPVSDSYDCEWGTAARGAEIAHALDLLHHRVSGILGNREPLYILDLVDAELSTHVPATLTEKEWRLIRFALERARESI